MNRQQLSIVFGIATALAVRLLAFGQGMAIAGPRDTGIPDYFNTPNWANSPPLRKFVDGLPGLDYAHRNNLGQYIPVAIPDQTTYPGSDYYEIEIGQYRERIHSDLPPIVNNTGGTLMRGYRQTNAPTSEVNQFHSLGPLIIATKDRAVRVKFTNKLPTGADGDLFVPVDTTIMGSGEFEINYNPETKDPIDLTTGVFTQNRAVIHLHGGRTPWISDGTAHQWITPKGESTDYPKGVSVFYVPDMWFDTNGNTITSCAGKTTCNVAGASNNPGQGSQTYYWTNQQSARMMFYHDHSWGITRLGVYVGGVAGYLIRDPAEEKLIADGLIPADEIPLIIQDKTYVDGTPTNPTYVLNTDPTWIWGSQPGTIIPWNPVGALPVTGDLWWPHVYMPAQNPYNPDLSGINAYGRWHYGPWFWPPTTDIKYGPVFNEYYDSNCVPGVSNNYFCQPPERPAAPNPSWGAEAFMDTPVVNGTPYPTLTVAPKQYRFRILNGAHDRFWNLQLYVADSSVPPGCPNCVQNSEVKMVPAEPTTGFPEIWPIDGRAGGVPDPATRGPAMIQIGTEGGFLPAPVLLPNQPVNWNVDMTTFTAGLVLQQNEGGGTLMIAPAERSDVIVDFTNFAGKTLILYNDAPAPWPALDPHYDYYTNDPDNRAMGGANTTPVGYGPNTRTIMQIKVTGSGGSAPVNDYNATILTSLQAAFSSTSSTKGVFATAQEPINIGQTAYNATYNKSFPATAPNWGVSRISDTSLNFMRVDGSMVTNYPMKPKAIQDEMGEVFDDYGRGSAKLGLELPATNATIQTFVLQNFVDPPTEIIAKDQLQIWKITHNGVDTHPLHFHISDVQLINRVGWDGFIYMPDPNELGWKDTVRINPLEDTIVAIRPAQFRYPFTVPESIRPLNPAFPLGSGAGFSNIDPVTANPVITINDMHNFGHEYLWHCHILSHEENDMMRVVVLNPNNKVDILWRNMKDGKNLSWIMADKVIAEGITPVAQTLLPIETDMNWEIVGRGDFNADSKPDILWRNMVTGANKVWYMDGNVRIGQAPILPIVADQSWKIVGTGDFNGDGNTDILWSNTTTLQNRVWYMNKILYTGSGVIAQNIDPLAIISGTGDFNGDGKSDILWRNTSASDGTITTWYMNGVTPIGEETTAAEPDQDWEIVGVGDFNNDIKPDILWRNKTTGDNRVWYMNGMVKLGETPLVPAIPDLNWKIVN